MSSLSHSMKYRSSIAAGPIGTVSINGTPVELEVPKGRRPVTIKVDEITVAVVSEELADETFHHAGTVYIGVTGLSTAFEQSQSARRVDAERLRALLPDGYQLVLTDDARQSAAQPKACIVVFDDVTFKPRCAVPIVQESQKLVSRICICAWT